MAWARTTDQVTSCQLSRKVFVQAFKPAVKPKMIRLSLDLQRKKVQHASWCLGAQGISGFPLHSDAALAPS